jgi:hypothetical protein
MNRRAHDDPKEFEYMVLDTEISPIPPVSERWEVIDSDCLGSYILRRRKADSQWLWRGSHS